MVLKFYKYFLVIGCLCVLLQLSPVRAERLDFDGRPLNATVTAEDCRKCHGEIVRLLQETGKAHQDLCLDCHRGHPPADLEIVPACSRCHSGAAHFDLEGCIGCHINPHTPLDIRLTKKITDACLTCHSEQIKQLETFPSIHTSLACTACHNYHGQLQPCQNCHRPHSDIMGAESCVRCHKAHMPLNVAYDQAVVPEYCGACHQAVFTTMAANLTRHRQVSCVSCHAEKHGMIPACEKCHGRPHPEVILEKFEKCGDCHGTAHELNTGDAITNPFVKNIKKL